jgi:LAO/AO transport system kinase
VSDSLTAAIAAGDTAALARAISLVEAGSPRGEQAVAALFGRTGRASVLGITGPPGAGKSSLVNRLIAHYRAAGRAVGVIAVDPSSAFSGGAILGDRIRMQQHAVDPAVFIRSMATRGQFGGLSRAARDVIDLMDAAGRDPVLVETVGVGQDEVDIARVADTVLVVLSPGQGDDVQAIKAGVLEIADLFVINKADHDGADRLAADLEGMLALGASRDWTPPILRTVATEGRGIAELADGIDRHGRFLRDGGGLERRRRQGLRTRLLEIVRDRLLQRLLSDHLGEAEIAAYADRVASRSLDPYAAAGEALARIVEERRGAGGAPGGGAAPGVILDHVGIAVRSVEARAALYRDLLGLELRGVEEVAGERVRIGMLPAGRTRIELVEPTAAGTAIARFLDKHGEGIHHLCFEVGDLDAVLARFRAAGATLAGDAGRPGAEGSRIAFIHPRDAGGVLIELRQARRPVGPTRAGA